MSSELAKSNYNLAFTEEEVLEAEAKVKNKSRYPTTFMGVAFVCTRIVINKYVDEHPMVHTNGVQFKEKVDRFLELITNDEEEQIARNGVVEERKKLEIRLTAMEKALKETIKVKHFDLLGNWQKRYGFGKYHSKICWGSRQEQIVRNMKKAVDTLQDVGHEGFQYSIEDYVELYENYSNLVRKGYINNNAKIGIATKNQVRDQLKKLMRAIICNLQSNYMDTWESKAMAIGFLIVRN